MNSNGVRREHAFHGRLRALRDGYEAVIGRENAPVAIGSRMTGPAGLWTCYERPVLTARHVPIEWRFDLDPQRNPRLLERLPVNSVFNAASIEFEDKVALVARIEGADRKSFFAVAESETGVDGFRFRERPIDIEPLDERELNMYDMRLTAHEDGWIYGVFCVEQHDRRLPPGHPEAPNAQCGLVRTRDLDAWERLPNIRTRAAQQRNAVLHPEFVDGRYAFYTRPQDGFIEAGDGGGIGFGTCESIERPDIEDERIVDPRAPHTVKESKNGLGPPPIKTDRGWLHLAHGVRGTAAGLRYVLYMFVCDLQDPSRVIARPGGYCLAPDDDERIGDVSNVLFSNGWVARGDGRVQMYYASSDTRTHVAESDAETLIDYCFNTPADAVTSAQAARQRIELIEHNSAAERPAVVHIADSRRNAPSGVI